LNIRFFNVFERTLILRDVVVRDLPRVMSINAMMRDKPITDIFDRTFGAWDRWGVRNALLQSEINQDDHHDVAVANRAQGRHISVKQNDKASLVISGRGLNCHTGITADDLFPATTMYITATIVDPDRGESKLRYQVAGRRAPIPIP